MDPLNCENLIKSNERIDQFKREKIQLIQSPDVFNMSADAILLSDFIQLPKEKSFRYLDFCSGNGVIPLLLSVKTKQKLYGVELQEVLVDMAQRSVKLNQLEGQVEIFQGDINQLKLCDWRELDYISCNPPYFLVENSTQVHQKTPHAIARHEIYLTLEQWVSQASRMLKTKGKLFIVHRPDRLDDLTEMLLNYKFSLNRIKFVYPKLNMNANIVLIEAIKHGGRRGVKIEPPLVVHRDDNSYTDQMMAVYYG